MKTARFVLKIVGASLALAGFVCLMVGYWDRLMDSGKRIVKCSCRPKEFDDYADVD